MLARFVTRVGRRCASRNTKPRGKKPGESQRARTTGEREREREHRVSRKKERDTDINEKKKGKKQEEKGWQRKETTRSFNFRL